MKTAQLLSLLRGTSFSSLPETRTPHQFVETVLKIPTVRWAHTEDVGTEASAAWLIDNGAILLGADTMGVEKFPMAKECVHTYAFAERGACLLELAWLEDLAKDKVYEFVFIAAPLKLRGATGSPIRPLALPLKVK